MRTPLAAFQRQRTSPNTGTGRPKLHTVKILLMRHQHEPQPRTAVHLSIAPWVAATPDAQACPPGCGLWLRPPPSVCQQCWNLQVQHGDIWWIAVVGETTCRKARAKRPWRLRHVGHLLAHHGIDRWGAPVPVRNESHGRSRLAALCRMAWWCSNGRSACLGPPSSKKLYRVCTHSAADLVVPVSTVACANGLAGAPMRTAVVYKYMRNVNNTDQVLIQFLSMCF